MRVGGLQLGVQIHLAVDRVAETMEPDAGVLVLTLRGHGDTVCSRPQSAQPEQRAVKLVLGGQELLPLSVY